MKRVALAVACGWVLSSIAIAQETPDKPDREKPRRTTEERRGEERRGEERQNEGRRSDARPPAGTSPLEANEDLVNPQTAYRRRIQDSIKELQARLEKLADTKGEDSNEYRQAERELRELKQREALFDRAAGNPPAVGLPGGPPQPEYPLGGASAEQARQMAEMMRGSMGMGPGGRGGFGAIPAGVMPPGEASEQGRRMVIQGLEMQVDELVREIARERDDEAREQKEEELEDLVERLVTAKTDFRRARIKRLERQLTELKEEEDKAESAEAMLERLKKRLSPNDSDDAREEPRRRPRNEP